MNILTTSKSHHEAVLKILYALGWKYHGREELASALGAYPHSRYPVLVVKEAPYLSGTVGRGGNNEDFVRFVLNELNKIEPTTVKLTEQYNAFVEKDHVAVGCQQIPHEKVLEVAKAIRGLA